MAEPFKGGKKGVRKFTAALVLAGTVASGLALEPECRGRAESSRHKGPGFAFSTAGVPPSAGAGATAPEMAIQSWRLRGRHESTPKRGNHHDCTDLHSRPRSRIP